MREDMRDFSEEAKRTRGRLHDLEGMTGLLVEQEKLRRETTLAGQKRMERRISLLAVAVSVAALVEPFLYHAANGG